MNDINPKSGNILLDAGTNELEVLIFRLAGGWFGLNVAKVREVVRPMPLNESPHRHPSVMGMFNMRGAVVPVVDLGLHLGLTEGWKDEWPEGRIIVTEFNQMRCGFLVDSVDRIHRMSWELVRPAPDLNVSKGRRVTVEDDVKVSSTTGNFDLDDQLILMVDFESVADSILLDRRLTDESVENIEGVDRASKRVVVAEDSPFMRNLMEKVLRTSGYVNLDICPDGLSAWETISAEGGDPIDVIVSDIEMPRMDGLHLCAQIKNNTRLKDIPVVLFSSLISTDNLKKGEQVGANVQMPKPELAEMVKIIDRAVSGNTFDNAYVEDLLRRNAA